MYIYNIFSQSNISQIFILKKSYKSLKCYKIKYLTFSFMASALLLYREKQAFSIS